MKRSIINFAKQLAEQRRSMKPPEAETKTTLVSAPPSRADEAAIGALLAFAGVAGSGMTGIVFSMAASLVWDGADEFRIGILKCMPLGLIATPALVASAVYAPGKTAAVVGTGAGLLIMAHRAFSEPDHNQNKSIVTRAALNKM